jgi:hypothetical protein
MTRGATGPGERQHASRERTVDGKSAFRTWTSSRWRALLCWAVGLVLFGLITHGHHAGSGDALHYMMITHSLAADLDLDMADDYRDPNNIVSGGEDIAGNHVRPGRGGTLRPVHDVGMPLPWTPYYAAAYRIAEASTELLPARLRRRARLDPWIMLRQLMSLSMIVVTAVLAGVFFDLALRLSGALAASAVATLLWGLSLGLAGLATMLPSWQRAPSSAMALSSVALVAWAAASVWGARKAR